MHISEVLLVALLLSKRVIQKRVIDHFEVVTPLLRGHQVQRVKHLQVHKEVRRVEPGGFKARPGQNLDSHSHIVEVCELA